ncbi:hypothetical protein M6B38_229680 [Iris pallida]|uniref:Uncharacterized protein n=1 Tax=Iris pallida TaxID=29817 RepID=A0AAX6DRU7_IRIPA|nr:hypothetical protein M6B38_229680 [Iris pallida]
MVGVSFLAPSVDLELSYYNWTPEQGKFTWGCCIFFMGQSPKPG